MLRVFVLLLIFFLYSQFTLRSCNLLLDFSYSFFFVKHRSGIIPIYYFFPLSLFKEVVVTVKVHEKCDDSIK